MQPHLTHLSASLTQSVLKSSPAALSASPQIVNRPPFRPLPRLSVIQRWVWSQAEHFITQQAKKGNYLQAPAAAQVPVIAKMNGAEQVWHTINDAEQCKCSRCSCTHPTTHSAPVSKFKQKNKTDKKDVRKLEPYQNGFVTQIVSGHCAFCVFSLCVAGIIEWGNCTGNIRKCLLVLTETRAFGCCTRTSRAQVPTPMDKFQLQVCPEERQTDRQTELVSQWEQITNPQLQQDK